MKFYFAPLEGITGYIYRRIHHALYPGMDRYYTPFIVPKEKKTLSTKERNDVLPENNRNMVVIPQILTNKSNEFLRIAYTLKEQYGYTEINLNLGCPSKTVVSKKRGAGFLAETDQLDAFLDEVCNGLEKKHMKLSVKTRIGKYNPEEFISLLDIFSSYPLSELIIHPRVQIDFYKNKPNLEAFSAACNCSKKQKFELCYNGDIFTANDYTEISCRFPEIQAVMLGRGLLVNPSLAEEIKIRENGRKAEKGSKTAETVHLKSTKSEQGERKRRYEMHCRLTEEYSGIACGEKNVLFKMKEIWLYMSQSFTNPEGYWKKMKKAQHLADFESAVQALCREQNLAGWPV